MSTRIKYLLAIAILAIVAMALLVVARSDLGPTPFVQLPGRMSKPSSDSPTLTEELESARGEAPSGRQTAPQEVQSSRVAPADADEEAAPREDPASQTAIVYLYGIDADRIVSALGALNVKEVEANRDRVLELCSHDDPDVRAIAVVQTRSLIHQADVRDLLQRRFVEDPDSYIKSKVVSVWRGYLAGAAPLADWDVAVSFFSELWDLAPDSTSSWLVIDGFASVGNHFPPHAVDALRAMVADGMPPPPAPRWVRTSLARDVESILATGGR